MTAPAERLFATEVANGLATWAATHDAHVRAAVGLLLDHDHWHHRGDFLAACAAHYPDEEMVVIRWRDVAGFAATASASTTQLAILELAAALGADTYRLGSMGHAHRRMIVDAITTAVRR